MNLGTKHKTYERAGFRNMLDEMCKSFVECGRRAALALRYTGGYPRGYRMGY